MATSCKEKQMRVRFAFLFLSLTALVAPHAAGQCIMIPTEVAYTVCTQWWDGSTSCHWQLGWEDVYSCGTNVSGGGPAGGGPGTGGGAPDPPPPPPSLEITDISDANPGQPVLRIIENDAVVETTLFYNGSLAMTTGKTDHLFLSALNVFQADTIVTVQARNAANVYATAICHIRRELRGPFVGATDVLAVWSALNSNGDPVDVYGEWNRTVHMVATQTSYDIATFESRNGEWEHNLVEDQIAGTTQKTPIPAWDTKYTIDNLQQLNFYYGTNCAIWPIGYTPYLYSTICTDVNAFSRAGSTAGKATILDLDIGQLTTGTFLVHGQEVSVWVY
jgi:hypothetical protein